MLLVNFDVFHIFNELAHDSDGMVMAFRTTGVADREGFARVVQVAITLTRKLLQFNAVILCMRLFFVLFCYPLGERKI